MTKRRTHQNNTTPSIRQIRSLGPRLQIMLVLCRLVVNPLDFDLFRDLTHEHEAFVEFP